MSFSKPLGATCVLAAAGLTLFVGTGLSDDGGTSLSDRVGAKPSPGNAVTYQPGGLGGPGGPVKALAARHGGVHVFSVIAPAPRTIGPSSADTATGRCPRRGTALSGQYASDSVLVVSTDSFAASRTSWTNAVTNLGSEPAQWRPGIICSTGVRGRR
jgi:hypothetical protein